MISSSKVLKKKYVKTLETNINFWTYHPLQNPSVQRTLTMYTALDNGLLSVWYASITRADCSAAYPLSSYKNTREITTIFSNNFYKTLNFQNEEFDWQTSDFECTRSGCNFFCHSLYFPSRFSTSISYFLSLSQ